MKKPHRPAGRASTPRDTTRSVRGTHVRLASRLLLALVVALAAAVAPYAFAVPPAPTDAGARAASPDASADATPDASAPADPAVRALSRAAAQIAALRASSLDPSVDPASLFDVNLDATREIDVEAHRLAAMLATLDADGGDAGAYLSLLVYDLVRDAGSDAEAGVARVGPPDVSTELLGARVALDRERLAFYRLAPAERAALLAAHEDRRRIAELEGGLSDAERKVQAAEEEQKRALEDARKARTEAQRRVREEVARLLGVTRDQAEFESELARRREVVLKRRDEALAFQRAVDERSAAAQAKPGRGEEDELYDDVRVRLRDARARLSTALTALGGASGVPSAGADPLASLGPDIDISDARKERAQVDEEAARLRALDEDLRYDAVKQLYDECEALNRKRIALLTVVTPAKKSSITGFGPAGIDQALAEARHVSLVVRYHLRLTTRWVTSIQTSGAERGKSAMSLAFFLVKVAFAAAIFVWWRRRAGTLLAELQKRVRAESRRARAVEPTLLEVGLGVVARVRGPLEWLAVLLVVAWFLPAEARSLLEVRILTSIFGWTLGGAFVVRAIDAVAARGDAARVRRSMVQTAHLRFQTLRLIGRVVVGAGLLLSVSERIVGEGTIYAWVITICIFLAGPIVLVIVRWWRSVIFERISLIRKKRAFDRWVEAKQEGWVSFPAAIAGGAYLLGTGLYRAGRAWIGRFDFTRRALAYLFQRGLDKMAEEKAALDVGRLPDGVFDALGPDVASKNLVGGVAEEELEAIVNRIKESGGGVFAVVGERGAGKSTLLRRIVEAKVDATTVTCQPTGGLGSLRRELARVLDLTESASIDEAGRALNGPGRDNALLLDDAHLLVHPFMGGLAEFDRLLDVARAHSSHCTWVFTLDEVIWRFLERSRGTRPLFDDVIRLEPWREEDIARLVTERCKAAKISPNFEHLLEKLPKDADEIDVEEALSRTSASFYRLLWDYAQGNPGVALHAWRTSLGVDAKGEVWVKLFQAPDSRDLDRLSDNVAFVLRAIVQLEPASLDDVRRATMLSTRRVGDAVRYALARGYVHEEDGRYGVTWAWFRPITRFLQRRHLLTPK